MASKKNAPKALLVNPTRALSTSPAACSVEMNSSGSAYVVTLKILVGSTEAKKSKKGKNYYQSGVLVVDRTIDIDGVPHSIRLNSGFYEGRRVGKPEIVLAPYISETDSEASVTVGDEDFK